MSTATTRACEEAGCHDFGDPVVVKHESREWFLIFSDRTTFETAVLFCRRCGAQANRGWEPVTTEGGE